jgi:heme/copper-type cytochrome/quinol oxidase subunit 2
VSPETKSHRSWRRAAAARVTAAVLTLSGLASGAIAAPPAEEKFQWSHWWLPSQHSEHGHEVDSLFVIIFWITIIALVLVQGVMIFFLIKYRFRKAAKRAHFIHGNTRLEMLWTVLPALILAVLALGSKKAWDKYRFTEVPDGERVPVMVVGEQFKWNVIYGGPDGKLGKYLQYPKVTDPRYRTLAKKDAIKRINEEMDTRNPLGQIATRVNADDETVPTGDDKDGEDDNWEPTPGRPLIIPVDRTIEVHVGSKDVLHSFALPNFRVKLDGVPGMIGRVYFKAEKGSESTVSIPVEQLTRNSRLWVDRDTPGAANDEGKGGYAITDPKNPTVKIGNLELIDSVARNRLTARGVADAKDEQVEAEVKALAADFKAAGRAEVIAVKPYDIVCMELCGQGHAQMGGQLIVVSQQQFLNFIHKNNPPTPTAPTTQRTVAAK